MTGEPVRWPDGADEVINGDLTAAAAYLTLVAGAPIRLDSRGSHELKGVPGTWEVLAVVS